MISPKFARVYNIILHFCVKNHFALHSLNGRWFYIAQCASCGIQAHLIAVTMLKPCIQITGIQTQVSIDAIVRFIEISGTTDEKIEKLPKNNKKIGIDLGIKDLVITSEGIKYDNPKTLIKWEMKITKLQRRLSRKKKGSKRYIEVKNKIARCHEKVSNIRKDNLHKISSKIVKENQIIVTEDLQVKNMMKNKKLSKVIGDASWYEFTRQLEYKSKYYGRTYIKIDKFYASSQLCHICGYKNEEVKNLSIRNWHCPKCNALSTFESHGDEIECKKCGLKAKYLPTNYQ